MAARKKRPVLYEVFRPGARTSDPTLRPRPFRSEREVERPAPVEEREEIVIRDTTPSSKTSARPSRHGRTLTISTSMITFVIAGMIVVLFVAFAAGRRYEMFHPTTPTQAKLTLEPESEPATPIALVADTESPTTERPAERRTSTSDREQPSPRAERPTAEPEAGGPPQVTLQRGYHYVVVQHFNKTRQQADALAAAKFLQENDVPCATLMGADIRLVVTEPFQINQTDATAGRREEHRANRLLERVKQLGQQYNKELMDQGKRGYTFSECYVQLIK